MRGSLLLWVEQSMTVTPDILPPQVRESDHRGETLASASRRVLYEAAGRANSGFWDYPNTSKS